MHRVHPRLRVLQRRAVHDLHTNLKAKSSPGLNPRHDPLPFQLFGQFYRAACIRQQISDPASRSFNDLSELLDPGKPSRTDKVSIIADAMKAINQLRAESHQMKQLNKFLEVRAKR